MRIHGLVIFALAAFAAAGCSSTMKEVYNAKAEGRSAVYPVPAVKAWEVTGDILWEATREYPEEHADLNFMCVQGGLGTDETLIGVWCDPLEDPAKTRVTVVIRRKSGIQVATVLTEEEFHDTFARATGAKRLP
jgi:hypothetical protein